MKIHREKREIKAREEKRKKADLLLSKVSRIEIFTDRAKDSCVRHQDGYTVLARSLIKQLNILDYRIILIRTKQRILKEYFWSGQGLFDYFYVRQNVEAFPGVKLYSNERQDSFFVFTSKGFEEVS
ncbi:MAG TPA: hypothetical protein DCY88_07880 [Cyanobacteria bacterium UBA11372]|nr:hypothetical protein [Cyanobacteria bacterium UBA11372]